MKACDNYRPWHDKASGKTFVRPDTGKCCHYYFYFMGAALGLVNLWLPTWAPLRLQFYWRQLSAAGIGYTMADNTFARIDDLRVTGIYRDYLIKTGRAAIVAAERLTAATVITAII